MSVRMMDQVWRTLDVHGTEKLLLLHLADVCDDQGVEFFQAMNIHPGKLVCRSGR